MQSFESEDKENNHVELEKQHHSDSGLDSSDSRPSEQQQRTIKDEVTESVQLLKSLAISDKQRDEQQPRQDEIVMPSPTEEALEDLLSIIPQVK